MCVCAFEGDKIENRFNFHRIELCKRLCFFVVVCEVYIYVFLCQAATDIYHKYFNFWCLLTLSEWQSYHASSPMCIHTTYILCNVLCTLLFSSYRRENVLVFVVVVVFFVLFLPILFSCHTHCFIARDNVNIWCMRLLFFLFLLYSFYLFWFSLSPCPYIPMLALHCHAMTVYIYF